MMRVVIGIGLVACVVLGVRGAGAEQAGPQVPKDWKFVMPAGDPAAGKAAFVKLQCTLCHKVPGAGLPGTRESDVGPELGPGYGKLPPEYVAESIVNRHKYIAGTLEKYTGVDKVSSKMSDLSDEMSVREMIDIVAFIHQLGAPAGKK